MGGKLAAVALAAMVTVASALRAADAPPLLAQTPAATDLTLVSADRVADVWVDAKDASVVRTAAGLFADDVERVTGKKPSLVNDAAQLGPQAVLVGTIGQSELIDRLIAEGKLDVSGVRGKWETFVIATVERPMPNVERALVIAGSDRRGTAFGVFEVSEQIGVSPWYWWADVTPRHRDTLAIKAGTNVVGPPRVKYRGFFINDEDWGLTPWASKTFEPEVGNVGPKTYAKVFELMLRLKANYLWPAMHPCTTEFAAVPGNVETADRWGIVMGASHPEPMLRNNVWYDQNKRGPWRYDTNRDNIIAYWEESARDRGKFEAVWTVGMRGIHDSGMGGPSDLKARTGLLAQAIDDQRDLLKKYVNPDVAKVPQAFVPYKEVLEQYQSGLKLADDITLVWPDDNYGYIRQLSTPDEQARSGRAGVYYHISYLGRPMPYLWVNTTPPALIWQQMQTALAFGADNIWVVNVGDIKPGEIGADFWAKLAWKPDRWSGPDVQTQFLTEWATREFGTEVAADVAGILNRYYQLGAQRKPELMSPNAFANAAEAAQRMRAMRSLGSEVDELARSIPADRRDAFTELVAYPVHVAVNNNLVFLYSDACQRAFAQGRSGASAALADGTLAALERTKTDTAAYNKAIANGKWDGMMKRTGFDAIGDRTHWGKDWLIRTDLAEANIAGATTKPAETNPRVGLHIEGRGRSMVAGQPFIAPVVADDIDLSVFDQTLPKPWTVDGEGDARLAGVPNQTTGDQRDPANATPVTFTFKVEKSGRYNLFAEILAPTDNDDSFFVRLDDQAWSTWNDIPSTGTTPAWRQQGSYDLAVGTHTVAIAPREDGAFVRRLRLSRRALAELPTAPSDNLPPDTLTLAPADHYQTARVHVFRTDGKPVDQVDVSADQPWIVCETEQPALESGEQILRVSLAPDRMPADASKATATVKVTAMDQSQSLHVNVVPLPAVGTAGEIDGVVSVEAEHPSRNVAAGEVAWRNVPHLGRTGDGAMTVFPLDAASVESPAAGKSAALEYDVVTTTGDRDVTLNVFCLPTYRLHAGRGLRYAVAIDDGTPQVIDFDEDGGGSGESGSRWNDVKRRNVNITQTKHRLGAAGKHTIHLWMVDPNVVVDKLVLDLGGLQPGELGPPETRQDSRRP